MRVIQLDPIEPDPAVIAEAAEAIRGGGLVAFPTETVYGLGADARNERAAARIYAAKGRPANNPLIVHFATVDDARALTTRWPESAERLARAFWPGPLTLVLPRSTSVPDLVTAGGPTVALRSPSHPVARALIQAAGTPIAAPSANRSGELSPTLAEHVRKSLEGRIDLLLDAGPTTAGLESTVVDLSGEKPRILRPGPIAPDRLRAFLGEVDLPRAIATTAPALPSPGMLARHYAPRTPLRFGAPELRERVGLLKLSSDPAEAAESLYRKLHELDDGRFDVILVDLPPETEEWLAVRDRLLRAAAVDD
jgi:L-threonylcarbamoyladenylate synthase